MGDYQKKKFRENILIKTISNINTSALLVNFIYIDNTV